MPGKARRHRLALGLVLVCGVLVAIAALDRSGLVGRRSDSERAALRSEAPVPGAERPAGNTSDTTAGGAEPADDDDRRCRVDAPLQHDATGPGVRCVLGRLDELGYEVDSSSARLDRQAVEALQAFQRDAGLTVDGLVGPATLTQLELWPGSTGPMEIQDGQVFRVGDGLVALTFDDGPSEHSEPILDLLARYDVVATFFVVGEGLAEHGATLQRILDDGHSLQNHSWAHPDLATSTWFKIHSQLSRTSDAIEEATGHRPSCYRPPEGSTNVRVRTVASELGLYPEVLWNVNPHDYEDGVSARTITTRSLEIADGRGLIIGLHDGGGDRSATLAALPELIVALRHRGYEFVTLCE